MTTAELVSVLYIDDDTMDHKALEREFKKKKIVNPLVHAKDGEEGLEILRGGKIKKPFVIILDLNMPRMNGLEFLEEIRKDSELKLSIVFVLTTSENCEDQWKAYSKSIAGYIVKDNLTEGFSKAVDMLDLYWGVVSIPK